MLARIFDRHLDARNEEKPGGRRSGFKVTTRANLAGSGLAVAATLAALASPLGMGVSAATPLKDTRVTSSSPTCAPPTTGAGTLTTTGDLQAGSSLLGDDADPLGIIGILADGAEGFAEDDGLGWLLNLLSGDQPGADAAAIQSQVSTIDSQISSLAEQQYQDCQAALSAINNAVNVADQGFYDDEATDIGNYVATIQNYQTDFNEIAVALQANGGVVKDLDSTYQQDLTDMLSGTPSGLLGLVDQINDVEGTAQGQTDNLVQLYAKILTENLGYDPYRTHIFPAQFVNAAYEQLDYYADAVDQAALLYANVAHLTAKAGTSSATSIIAFLNVAQADIHSWSVSFSDGPPGDGTANWVSQGNNQAISGPVPDDTVLDYRIQGHPMLWTDSPVALPGYPANPVPYYCASTAQFCYDDTFVGGDAIGASSLVLQSPEPLPTMVAGDDYDGLSGWRIPTLADWRDLQAGATSELTVWGPAQHFDMFAPVRVTSHVGGKDISWDVIPPVLADTGGASGPYGVLDWYPGTPTLTLEQPSFGGNTENDIAGRLFLVQDFQPASTPAPFSAPTLPAPRPAPAKDHVTATPSAGEVAQAVPSVGSTAPAQVAGPTSFFNPSPCSSTNSYTVPDGVSAVQIVAVGGAGAPGALDGSPGAAGGGGGLVIETFPVTPGETLYYQVGGHGVGGQGGIGGGGNGGGIADRFGDVSGGGGGASGVSSTPDCSQWLVVAGGGGGGGSGLYFPGDRDGDPPVSVPGGQGGSGCPETGYSCQAATADTSNPEGGTVGQPGQPSPNNVGGSPSGGTGGSLTGGTGGTYQTELQGGGGGGAGYYGGGGGGGGGFDAGGGGGAGGASFAVPGGSGIGYSVGAAGQNGSVTFTPIAAAAAPISVSASSTSLTWGEPVTLTATLPANATGTVGFYDGALPGPDKGIGTAPIQHGTATLANPTIPLALGTHSLYAWYGGDSHYLGGGSAPVTVTVSKATPSMTLTVDGTDLSAGEEPKSLVVQMPPGATGKVTFYDEQNGACEGTSPKPTCNVLGVTLIDNGYAAITPAPGVLASGAHSEYATYDGDGNFLAGKSNIVSVTIRKASSSATSTTGSGR